LFRRKEKKRESDVSSSIDNPHIHTRKDKIADAPEHDLEIRQSISDTDIKIVDFQSESESKNRHYHKISTKRSYANSGL
jgi:hypothetical protein